MPKRISSESTEKEAKGQSDNAATWITRAAQHLLGRFTQKSVGIQSRTSNQSKRGKMNRRHIRQILQQGCSISADSAVLSSHHRRGYGNIVATAGRMANEKVSVRLRVSKEDPKRHISIKQALERNNENILVEINFKEPIREFFAQIDRKNHHIHFGPAPDYIVDEFLAQSLHLYLVMDDEQCVKPHQIPLSLAIKAVVA